MCTKSQTTIEIWFCVIEFFFTFIECMSILFPDKKKHVAGS